MLSQVKLEQSWPLLKQNIADETEHWTSLIADGDQPLHKLPNIAIAKHFCLMFHSMVE